MFQFARLIEDKVLRADLTNSADAANKLGEMRRGMNGREIKEDLYTSASPIDMGPKSLDLTLSTDHRGLTHAPG